MEPAPTTLSLPPTTAVPGQDVWAATGKLKRRILEEPAGLRHPPPPPPATPRESAAEEPGSASEQWGVDRVCRSLEPRLQGQKGNSCRSEESGNPPFPLFSHVQGPWQFSCYSWQVGQIEDSAQVQTSTSGDLDPGSLKAPKGTE